MTGFTTTLGEWLIQNVQNVASDTPTGQEFHVTGARNHIVRILHWNTALTPKEVQQLVTNLRTQVEISWLFTYYATHALAVRGTAAQLTAAAYLVANYRRSN